MFWTNHVTCRLTNIHLYPSKYLGTFLSFPKHLHTCPGPPPMFHNHFSGQKFAEELQVFSSFLFPWKSSLYSQPSQFCAGIVIKFHCPGLLNSWITAIMKPSLSWFYSEWNYQTMQDSNDRPSTKLNVCIEECMMHLTNYRNWKQWCFCFYNLFRADVALMGLKVTDGII